MNETQEYFIKLLSSHLNNSPPPQKENADWMGVFKLGELHNVTAMLCLEIKKLPAQFRPEKNIMSIFNQALGLAVQRYDNKTKSLNALNEVLNENKIPRLFLKGAAIKDLYPTPEVRTSGDIDLVVNKIDFDVSTYILVQNGFELAQKSDIQSVLIINDEEFELKNYIDCFNKNTELFFNNPFDESKSENITEYVYHLKPTYHLIYIISHIIKHLITGGVGLRQLMDVDVLIRSGLVDTDLLFKIARELNIEKSVKVIISLSKDYFNTPIDLDYQIENQLKESLESVILNGGVFGFAISNPGTIRLTKSVNNTKSSGFLASVKALLMMIFVNKNYLYTNYPYSNNHHFLLPIAFLNRLFDAIFKRGKSNVKNVKTIFKDKETAIMLSDIIDELEIEKDF